MWFDEELDRLKALFDDVEGTKLYEFLEDEELETIDEKSVRYGNLRSRLIPPGIKARNKFSTVTIQRLYTDDFDFDDWLSQIAKTVCWSQHTMVQVGFAFIGKKTFKFYKFFKTFKAWKPTTNEHIYLWAGRGNSPFNFEVSSQAECLRKFAEIGKMSHPELLNETFITEEEDYNYYKSGFCPKKIVSTYVWIQK